MRGIDICMNMWSVFFKSRIIRWIFNINLVVWYFTVWNRIFAYRLGVCRLFLIDRAVLLRKEELILNEFILYNWFC